MGLRGLVREELTRRMDVREVPRTRHTLLARLRENMAALMDFIWRTAGVQRGAFREKSAAQGTQRLTERPHHSKHVGKRSGSASLSRHVDRHSNTSCLILALTQRGIEHRLLALDRSGTKRSKPILSFSIDGVPFYFTGACLLRCDPQKADHPGAIIDGAVAHFLKQKDEVKDFLCKHGISVPVGKAFCSNALEEAESYFVEFSRGLHNGVCVKPTNGNMGHLVHVGVQDLCSFRDAFASVGLHYRKVLVEESVLGPVYRFTWLAGRVIFVEYMRPASVKGDGVHSITELVRRKNVERRVHPTHSSRLRLGPQQREFLGKAGLHPDDIPEADRRVFLSSLSNLHQGADCIETRDEIHETYINLIESTLKLLDGLVFCGVDVAIPNASQPAKLGKYHVLELNRCPGFSTCHYPWRGKAYDVAGAIVDFLSNKRVSIGN